MLAPKPMWMCTVFPAEYFWVSELHLDTLDSKTAVHVRDKYIHSLYTCTFSSDVSLCTSAWRASWDGHRSGDEAVVNPTVRTVVSSLDFSTYCRRYRLQALVYDILPSTTAITDYAIDLEKPSVNGQFFVEMNGFSLEQTTQIIRSGVSFITRAHVAYTSTTEAQIVRIVSK